MISVGTPPLPDGRADTSAVESVAEALAEIVPDQADVVLAIKSTVPPGTTDAVQELIDKRFGATQLHCQDHYRQ